MRDITPDMALHDTWPLAGSQAVCEESSNDYSYGSKKPRKERYVAQVMTPASPHYLHGLIDSQQVAAAAPPAAPGP